MTEDSDESENTYNVLSIVMRPLRSCIPSPMRC